MEITYEKTGGYELPMLASAEAPAPALGTFAQMRLGHLKKHRRGLYTNLLATGKLNDHLAEVESQAAQMMERLTSQMEEREGVNEAMKRADRMGWAGLKNSIQASARETVARDLIYS